MDLVKILHESVEKLPQGSHTPGLHAILRHIAVAVRHFDGDKNQHSDRFTDAIYRTNQAYEGSLKEAYRVIAARDPSKKTPYQIEEFFEENGILRDRVLVQIKRYRQDYRNPSTHDHKLDFDQNEALLAIASTCGFAKLLVDQIAERLAFQVAVANPPNTASKSKFANSEDLALFAAKVSSESLKGITSFSFNSELEGLLGGSFTAAGLDVATDVPNAEGENWDMVVRKEDIMVPIEIRQFGPKFSVDDHHGTGYLDMAMETEELSSGINIIFSRDSRDTFDIFELLSPKKSKIFLVSNYKMDEIRKIKHVNSTFENITLLT